MEHIIEPMELNLTKNPNFSILVFQRFFGFQASYRAETLTPNRSRAPRRGEKSENLSNRSDRAIDRSIGLIDGRRV